MKTVLKYFALFIFIGALAGCGKNDVPAQSNGKPHSLADFDGKNIGVLQGTIHDKIAEERWHNAKIFYYKDTTDMILALERGTIDGYISVEPSIRCLMNERDDIEMFGEMLSTAEYAYIFAKNTHGEALQKQMNAFLSKLRTSGTLLEIRDVWTGKDESKKNVEIPTSGKNGSLKFATALNDIPFAYIKDGKPAGYDVDIAVRFCTEYGYALEIVDMDFAALLAGVTAGKYDFGADGIAVTDERKEAMLFSDANYDGGNVLVVKKSANLQALDSNKSSKKQSIDFKSDKTVVAVEPNTIMEAALDEAYPNVKKMFITNATDGFLAVKTGKADAYAADVYVFNTYKKTDAKRLSIYEEIGKPGNIAAGISKTAKIEDLKEKVNKAISELNADGTFDEMYNRWVTEANYNMPKIEEPENPEMTIRVGTTGLLEPYTFYAGNALTGYDIELARRVAQKLNAKIEFSAYTWEAIIPAVLLGKVDLVLSNLMETVERTKQIDFSVPYYQAQTALIVRDEALSADAKSNAPSKITLSDFNSADKKIGIQTGTTYDALVAERFPKAQPSFYNNYADLTLALTQGMIDGFIADESVAITLAAQNSKITLFPEMVYKDEYAFIFGKDEKGRALQKQMDDFLEKISNDGTLEKIKNVWLGTDESKQVIEMPNGGANGTLVMATEATYKPFVYIKNGKFVGYDIDVASRFCREYGYALKVANVDFTAIVPGVASGKYDFASGGISITPERAESVLFSAPNYIGGAVMVVKKDDVAVGNAPSEITLSDFNKPDIKIGVETGDIFDVLAKRMFPNAEIIYYNGVDLIVALKAKKIDAFVMDGPIINYVMMQEPSIDMIDEVLEPIDYAFAFKKDGAGELLKNQMDEYLDRIKKDGSLSAIEKIWFDADEKKKTVKIPSSGKNGTLTMAVDLASPPLTYFKDDKLVGYSVDIAARFASEYGYALKIYDMDFGAVIASVTSGKYDFAGGYIAITPERKKTVFLSQPAYSGGAQLAILKDRYSQKEGSAAPKKGSFFSSVASSFEKTFIRESRWKLILEGIGTTMLISLFAAIFGTALGFGVCMVRRSKNKIASGAAIVYIRVLQGTPIVVFLMILYYIVFGKSSVPAVWVAIIGFAMNFAAYVSEMMRTGIDAVDNGQVEAALAIGFNKFQTFTKIVMPQAARHFLPVYKGELISLVKSTSIVGYIAIQDLTKMSDIIRSRTYEAFFPLIATAIIYFALAYLLTLVLNFIMKKIEPKRGSKKAFGVVYEK